MRISGDKSPKPDDEEVTAIYLGCRLLGTSLRATSRLFSDHCSRSKNRLLLLHRRGFTASRRCRRGKYVAVARLSTDNRTASLFTFPRSACRPGSMVSVASAHFLRCVDPGFHRDFPWVYDGTSGTCPFVRVAISRPPLAALRERNIAAPNGVRTFLIPFLPGRGRLLYPSRNNVTYF